MIISIKKRIRWAIAVILPIIMSGCANTNTNSNTNDNANDKLEAAIDYYRGKGYHIMRQVDYILFSSNDTIYMDTEFKKNGKSAQKIFPDENGTKLKKLKIDFRNGIAGTMESIDINKIISSFFDISSTNIQFHDENNSQDKDLLVLNIGDRAKIYYNIGSNEGLVTNTVNSRSDHSKLFCEETFTLRNIYDGPYDSFLADYPITIVEEFSLVDLSFTKLASIKYNKKFYPWEFIKEKIGNLSWITDDGNYFYTPVGNEYTDKIRELIAMDINNKLLESEREQAMLQEAQREAERQREMEDMRRYVLDNAIYFPDMVDDYRNPIKAEKKYTIGMNIILKIKLEEIGLCSGGDCKYYMKDDGYVDVAYLYSNDEGFAELDYPTYVWVEAKYYSRYTSSWDNVTTYKFDDAKLLMWKKTDL